MSIYDASQEYIKNNIDTVIIAGKEYGTGSSKIGLRKDKAFRYKGSNCWKFWKNFPIHLIGMGVLPLEFIDGNKYELQIKVMS